MEMIKENRKFNEALISLREKNSDLENDSRSIREQLRQSEEARVEADSAVRDVQRKFAALRAQMIQALQEKDEQHKRDMLELETQHNRELAQKAAENAALRHQEAKGEVPDAQKGASLAVANKRLVAKLEELEVAFTREKSEWSHERRMLMSANAQEIQELNTLHREQGSTNVTYIAKLEDEIEDLRSQLEDAKKLITVVQRREDESNARREAAEAAQDRLAADKRELVEHLQAAHKLEVTSSDGVVVDGEKAMAALTATSEAKVRHANNKVEYLKAQLASEQTHKAELEASVGAMKEKLGKAKSETRRLLAVAEETKKQAVQDAEERVRHEMENYMAEVAHLQGKMMTLQGQLSDALQDAGMAKRREEGHKGEFTKSQLEVSALQFEIETLKKQIEDHAKTATLDEDYRAKMATSDAMLRRLDNERLYLKSQLATEITCKNELQHTLDVTQREQAEAKAAWKKAREGLEESARQAHIKREAVDAELKRYRIQMEAEVSALSQSNYDLKTSYGKTREQLRIEQAALERVQAVSRRLQDELLAAHEELKQVRAAGDEATGRHAQNMEAMKASIEELEADKASEIARLQTEMHGHLQRLAKLQEELAMRQDAEVQASRAHRRQLAAQRIFLGVAKWEQCRRACVLHRWRLASVCVSMAQSAEKRQRKAVEEVTAQARVEREAELSSLEKLLRQEKTDELEKVTQLAEHEMDRLKREALDEKAKALSSCRQQWREVIERTAMEAEERLARATWQWGKEAAKARFEWEERQLRMQMDHEIEGNGLRRQADERVQAERQKAKEEAELRWQVYVKDKLAEVKRERAMDLDAARDQYNKALDTKSKEFERETLELKRAALEQQLAAIAQERKAAQEKVAEAMERGRGELQDAVQDAQRQHQQQMMRREAEHADKMRAVEEAMKALEQSHVKMTVELRRSMDEQRARALANEAAKWEKALAEAEQQMEAEKVVAYQRGFNDRDNRAAHEAAQLNITHELAMQEAREAARMTLEVSHQKAGEALEKARAALLAERDDALKEQCAQLMTQAQQQLEEAVRGAVEEKEKALTAVLEDERASGRVAVVQLEQRINEHKVQWDMLRRELEGQITAHKQETEMVRVAMRQAMDDADKAFDNARTEWSEAQREALRVQAVELFTEKDKALEAAAEAAAADKASTIAEVQRKDRAALDATVRALQEERERIVAELEGIIATVRHEKREVEKLLSKRKEELEEVIGRNHELEGQISQEHRRWSFEKIKLLAAVLKHDQQHQVELKAQHEQADAEKAKSKQERGAVCQAYESQLDDLRKEIEAREAKRLEMYETLVNHKREVLLEHKVQSEVLAREVEQLVTQREDVEAQKVALQRELRNTEESAKDLEDEMREHSKKSSIKHGRIDVLHARKKKRLDEDLEAVFESIEAKRAEINTVDSHVAELVDLRQDKDDEIKALERKLVEVLVEQQKKLLQLLAEEGMGSHPGHTNQHSRNSSLTNMDWLNPSPSLPPLSSTTSSRPSPHRPSRSHSPQPPPPSKRIVGPQPGRPPGPPPSKHAETSIPSPVHVKFSVSPGQGRRGQRGEEGMRLVGRKGGERVAAGGENNHVPGQAAALSVVSPGRKGLLSTEKSGKAPAAKLYNVKKPVVLTPEDDDDDEE